MTDPPIAGLGDPEAPSSQPAGTAPIGPGFDEFWARFKEHKVLQWTLAYAAGAYTLLHVAEMVSGAFHWPEVIIQVITVTLALGVPIAIIVAWYHGYKAKHRISGPELTMITIMLVIAGSVLWALARNNEAKPLVPAAATTVPSTTTAPRTAVAVLPFANLTGDDSKEYLGDGMAEELIDTLTKVQGLKVPARTSTFAYKGRNTDIRQIAKDLGVGTVLEGSVRAAGKRIRITAQLINAQDGLHLWSQTYDEQFTDIFKLQDNLAKAIVQALQGKLQNASSAGVTQTPPTPDVEAYNDYLQGESLVQLPSVENVAKATGYFQQALVRDPKFARAWAGIALAQMNLFGALGVNRDTSMVEVERAALHALSLDPGNIEAREALGGERMLTGRWLEMGAQDVTIQRLSSNNGYTRAIFSTHLAAVGRLREARVEAAAGYRLAPASAMTVTLSAYAYSLAGDEQEALHLATIAGDLGATKRAQPLLPVLMRSALRARRYQEATDLAIENLQVTGSTDKSAGEVIRLAYRAMADASARPAAVSARSRLYPRAPAGAPAKSMAQTAGCMTASFHYAMLTLNDVAYELADQCLDESASSAQGSAFPVVDYLMMYELKGFRRDARFQALATRLGLMDYWQQYGPPDDCDLKDGKLTCH